MTHYVAEEVLANWKKQWLLVNCYYYLCLHSICCEHENMSSWSWKQKKNSGESLMELILIVRSLPVWVSMYYDSMQQILSHNCVRRLLFSLWSASPITRVPETPLKCTSLNNHKYWCYYSWQQFHFRFYHFFPYFCSIRMAQNTHYGIGFSLKT